MAQVKGLYIDERVVRSVAAQVSLLSVVILFTGWLLPALFLVADFAIRAFSVRVSPLAFIAKSIVKTAGWQPRPIFAPPKKFAALLGFVFSLGISVLLMLHAFAAAWVVTSILLICAVLESVFSICPGCYVFNLVVLPLQRLFRKQR